MTRTDRGLQPAPRRVVVDDGHVVGTLTASDMAAAVTWASISPPSADPGTSPTAPVSHHAVASSGT
jgi:hypothetical protein